MDFERTRGRWFWFARFTAILSVWKSYSIFITMWIRNATILSLFIQSTSTKRVSCYSAAIWWPIYRTIFEMFSKQIKPCPISYAHCKRQKSCRTIGSWAWSTTGQQRKQKYQTTRAQRNSTSCLQLTQVRRHFNWRKRHLPLSFIFSQSPAPISVDIKEKILGMQDMGAFFAMTKIRQNTRSSFGDGH